MNFRSNKRHSQTVFASVKDVISWRTAAVQLGYVGLFGCSSYFCHCEADILFLGRCQVRLTLLLHADGSGDCIAGESHGFNSKAQPNDPSSLRRCSKLGP